jgi:osmotically-inducible protein OsmY
MKKISIMFFSLLLFFHCSQLEKDEKIKATMASTAKLETAFAGVDYRVENGIVTLSGNAPTEKVRNKVEERVKNLPGVKEVVNRISIEPVVPSADYSLKYSVDSVLKKYPNVKATIKDGVITVQGTADSKKAVKLFNALSRLNPKSITNEMVITSVSNDANAAN